VIGGGLVFGLVLIVGFLGWGSTLGGLNRLHDAVEQEGAVVLTWRDGAIIEHRRPAMGTPIDVTKLPVHVTAAFLVAEDDGFYVHDGVTWPAILRALVTNFRAGSVREGGSTITQQIVKNAILQDRSQTQARKIREMFIARNLERDLQELLPDKVDRKNAVLGFYLASSDFGTGAGGDTIHGLDLAARIYFGKAPRNLSMAEAAVLAAVLNATDANNPCRAARGEGRSGWENAAARARGYILRRMIGADPTLTQAAVDAAQAELDTLRPLCRAPEQSVRWALTHIDSIDGLGADADRRPGLPQARVYVTTLDREAQELASRIVAEEMRNYPELQVAMVAMAGDGSVRALIGGKDFATSNYNRAIPERGRQVGSIYKAFIFAAAAERGARPEDLCRADGGAFTVAGSRSWNVAGGAPDATLTLGQGFAASSNAVAVRLAYTLGRDEVTGLAAKLGYRSEPDDVSSWPLVATGKPIHVAAAFAAFGNGGRAVGPRFLHRASRRGDPVLAPGTVAAMARMGRAVRSPGGTGAIADVAGLDFAAKTGTTNSNRDAWFVAWGGDFSLVIWIGADRPRATSVSGSTLPARIAARFLREQTLGWGRSRDWADVLPAREPRTFTLPGRENFCGG
jgi:penicillin-binding protein 1A